MDELPAYNKQCGGWGSQFDTRTTCYDGGHTCCGEHRALYEAEQRFWDWTDLSTFRFCVRHVRQLGETNRCERAATGLDCAPLLAGLQLDLAIARRRWKELGGGLVML